MMRSILLLTFVLGIYAWGKQGHMMVAQIAADRIKPATAAAIATFTGTGYTLPTIAPLPDDFDHSSGGKWSAPCHYCNLPRGATGFTMKYCPGFCVVESIKNYTQILTTEASNPTECDFSYGVEPCALTFLTHYVGDVHQPLHVGYGDDAGGNTVHVTWYGETTNLHHVWDVSIITQWNPDWQSGAQELESLIANHTTLVKHFLSVTDPVLWANESFGYVLSTVYDYQDAKLDTPALGDAYYQTNLPIVQYRLMAAGVRLAALLDNIFASNDNEIIQQN